jgi:hypothetical protein
MTEDLSQEWTVMSKSLQAGQSLGCYVVILDDCTLMKEAHFGTKVIVDDILLFANNIHALLLLWRCSLVVFLHHRASIKLKKCRIMPTELEFFSVSLSRSGNRPAASKSPTYEALVKPATTSDLRSVKGVFYWYSWFLDWFGVNTAPWQKILSSLTDQKDMDIPAELWTTEYDDLLLCIKKEILEGPLLAQADSMKRFYLKTDWPKYGTGAVLLQAENSDSSASAVLAGDTGGPCLFDRTRKVLILRPIMFFQSPLSRCRT